jgi:hypothetical protein
MAARATINVVSATADIDSTTEATISTSYVSAEASAYIDENSGNRWNYEVIPLGDLIVQVFNKNANDDIPITDIPSYSLDKVTTENLALVESFVKIVSYNRSFNDAFTLDDISSIDKNFYGNKGNIAFILDIIGLGYEKLESEAVTVSDIVEITLAYLRTFTEISTLTDTSFYTLEKTLSDSITLDDTSLINKDFLNVESNNFGITDILSTGISKGITETISFNEAVGLQYNKPLNNSMSLSELVELAIESKRVLNGLHLNKLHKLN